MHTSSLYQVTVLLPDFQAAPLFSAWGPLLPLGPALAAHKAPCNAGELMCPELASTGCWCDNTPALSPFVWLILRCVLCRLQAFPSGIQLQLPRVVASLVTHHLLASFPFSYLTSQLSYLCSNVSFTFWSKLLATELLSQGSLLEKSKLQLSTSKALTTSGACGLSFLPESQFRPQAASLGLLRASC